MIIAEALNPREPFSIERRRLLEHLTQRNYAYLIAHSNESLSASQEQLFNTYLTRLKGGEPLAYILGEQEFYGLSFKVNPQVLIPRPDTELLVDHALSLIQTLNHPQVIDLGTGSGAIAITLTKHCPALTMTATDVSPAALSLAQHNAKLILKDKSSSVIWLQSNWFEQVTGLFDVIVSNPPYIAPGDPHLHGDGLPFEPQLALTADNQGTQALASIIKDSPRYLKRPGYLFLEHGYDQAAFVAQALEQEGFTEIKLHLDFNHHPRLTQGTLR